MTRSENHTFTNRLPHISKLVAKLTGNVLRTIANVLTRLSQMFFSNIPPVTFIEHLLKFIRSMLHNNILKTLKQKLSLYIIHGAFYSEKF